MQCSDHLAAIYGLKSGDVRGLCANINGIHRLAGGDKEAITPGAAENKI
jgi:hypothetical protein